jgi:hypothetical protein
VVSETHAEEADVAESYEYDEDWPTPGRLRKIVDALPIPPSWRDYVGAIPLLGLMLLSAVGPAAVSIIFGGLSISEGYLSSDY